MKNTITVILCLILTNTCFSQSGWHIVENNCTWLPITPSGSDISLELENKKNYSGEVLNNFIDNPNKFDNSMELTGGDVVFVLQKIGSNYLCMNLDGRAMALKGTLTKVVESSSTGVAYLAEDIQLANGNQITNEYVWVVSQNTAAKTVTILIADGKTVEVPEDKIEFSFAEYSSLMKAGVFKKLAD